MYFFITKSCEGQYSASFRYFQCIPAHTERTPLAHLLMALLETPYSFAANAVLGYVFPVSTQITGIAFAFEIFALLHPTVFVYTPRHALLFLVVSRAQLVGYLCISQNLQVDNLLHSTKEMMARSRFVRIYNIITSICMKGKNTDEKPQPMSNCSSSKT